MTTQSTGFPESIVQPSRKLPSDGHSAKDTGEVDSPELRVRLKHAVESSKARVTEWRDGFQEGVRSRPIQSVLIAAAVGAVIGLLVGRRGR
jgi:ElaB/YqjD/DUF883 family membrane-anchored ribosome-binding protein